MKPKGRVTEPPIKPLCPGGVGPRETSGHPDARARMGGAAPRRRTRTMPATSAGRPRESHGGTALAKRFDNQSSEWPDVGPFTLDPEMPVLSRRD